MSALLLGLVLAAAPAAPTRPRLSDDAKLGWIAIGTGLTGLAGNAVALGVVGSQQGERLPATLFIPVAGPWIGEYGWRRRAPGHNVSVVMLSFGQAFSAALVVVGAIAVARHPRPKRRVYALAAPGGIRLAF